MAEDTVSIENLLWRVVEGEPALQDLLRLQALRTQGLRAKQLRAAIESIPGLPMLPNPGLRAKQLRAAIDSEPTWPNLLQQQSQGLGGRGTLPAGIQHPMEFPFTGAMILDSDPLKIGLDNFADLQNLRYTDVGLEGIAGYTRITTTPLGSVPTVGIQLYLSVGGISQSTVLVQSGTSLVPHAAIVPAAGDFGTALTTVTGTTGGRFSLGPNNHLLYANGTETLIWGGGHRPVQAVINFDNLSDDLGTFAHDFTELLNNTLNTSESIATLVRGTSDSKIWLHIGSTRPLQGIAFTVIVANTAASTTRIQYWNGSFWTTVAGFTDGTAAAGVTLAQSGTMSFTSTVTTAYTRYLYDAVLYWYRVRIGDTGTPDATIQISYVTTDAPIQPVVDIWDGVERSPVYAMNVLGGNDFTLEVQEPSPVTLPKDDNPGIPPIGMNMVNSGACLLGFEERMTALKFRVAGSWANSQIVFLTVHYWNGGSWSSVGAVNDGTSIGGASVATSGPISWTAPPATSERVYMQTNTDFTSPYVMSPRPPAQCYLYLLSWSGPLSNPEENVDPIIDMVTGIPAQRWNQQNRVLPATFPLYFAGRAMLVGSPSTNELHRIEYSAVQQPDVHNGEQSSARGKAIFVGADGALTSGLALSNRYYGTSREIAVLTKGAETWVLEGAAPETFTLYQLSDVVGNPAPYTLTKAEISVTAEQQQLRHVAMWCSAKGPMMCDGSTIFPMRFTQPDGAVSSIDPYFHPGDSRYVNTAAWAAAVGWYDAQWGEYHLLLPSGSGQTTPNVWLVCDLRRKKWYKMVPASYPRMVVPVEDRAGDAYVYAGLASGHLVRLGFGTTWDGTAIVHQVDTADILFAVGGEAGRIWRETLVRYVKLLLVTDTGVDVSVTTAHSPNGTDTYTTLDTLSIIAAGRRWTRETTPVNLRALSHQFRFSITTSDKLRAPQLLGFAALFRSERRTVVDIF